MKTVRCETSLGRVFRVQRERIHPKVVNDTNHLKLTMTHEEAMWKITMTELGDDAKITVL